MLTSIIFPLFSSHGNAVQITDSVVERLFRNSEYRKAVGYLMPKTRNLSGDPRMVIYYCTKMSLAHLRLRNIDSSLLFARCALKYVNRVNDSALISGSWKAAAYAYNNSGQLDSALYFSYKILEYAQRNGDKKLTGNAMTSIGTLLMQNKKYDEALKYFHEAHRLNVQLNDSLGFAASNFNLGLVWLNLDGHDSCLIYLDQAAQYAARYKQKDVLVYIYGTMADCYMDLNNEKERRRYLMLAGQIAEDLGNMQFVAMGYSNLAESALKAKQYQEALSFGQKAIDYLRKSPYPVLKMKLDSMLYTAFKATGQPAKAMEYFESFVKQRNQILNERQEAQLDVVVAKLKANEKDLLIARLEIELQERRRTQLFLVLLLILSAVSITGFIVYINSKKRFRHVMFLKEKEVETRLYRHEKKLGLSMKTLGKDLGDTGTTLHTENSEQTEAGNTLQHVTGGLLQQFEQEKIYLDPDLNQDKVIQLLGTNRRMLQQAINTLGHSNFRMLINRYRIDEAKRLLHEQAGKTGRLNIEALYLQTGFNNTVSFYRTFKLLTGLTPKEYYLELKKDMSTPAWARSPE